MREKIYCGIDYSMTSPSCCVTDGKVFKFLSIQGVKKQCGLHKFKNLEFNVELAEKNYKNNIERYVTLSKRFLDFIHGSFEGDKDVMIEGYSFGSSGAVFNIAENTQTLKIRLYNDPNINLLEPVPPKTVKSFATENGNADKALMHYHFKETTGINLFEEFNVPLTSKSTFIYDAVDAYWIAQYNMKNPVDK